MNVLNVKARCLRNSIEAEKGKDKPNQNIINELETELLKVLEELGCR